MLTVSFKSTDGKIMFAPSGYVISRRGRGSYTRIMPMHFIENKGWMLGEAFLVPVQAGRAVAEATYNAWESAKR